MKSIFASKTFWYGVAQIVFGLAGTILGFIDQQLALGLIMTGVGSIGFRLNSSTAVSLTGK